MNKGDEVRYISLQDRNIPYGTMGTVVSVDEELDMVKVQFDGIHHDNIYEPTNVWECCFSELILLKKASKSSEKPSDNLTLTIPLVEGADYLRGQFEDSEGNVYSVHVEKLPLMRKKQV